MEGNILTFLLIVSGWHCQLSRGDQKSQEPTDQNGSGDSNLMPFDDFFTYSLVPSSVGSGESELMPIEDASVTRFTILSPTSTHSSSSLVVTTATVQHNATSTNKYTATPSTEYTATPSTEYTVTPSHAMLTASTMTSQLITSTSLVRRNGTSILPSPSSFHQTSVPAESQLKKSSYYSANPRQTSTDHMPRHQSSIAVYVAIGASVAVSLVIACIVTFTLIICFRRRVASKGRMSISHATSNGERNTKSSIRNIGLYNTTLLIGNVTADPSPSNAVSEETDSHSPQHNIEETKHLFESRFESIYDSSTFTRTSCAMYGKVNNLESLSTSEGDVGDGTNHHNPTEQKQMDNPVANVITNLGALSTTPSLSMQDDKCETFSYSAEGDQLQITSL